MPKKQGRKKKVPTAAGSAGAPSATGRRVRVRMYRQGLGDCFLLSFASDGNLDTAAHVLTDCGTLGATTTGVKMADVAADIDATTKHHLALLIATHEHLDHVSGFNSQREIFDAITVDNSWVAWTENPEDKLAQSLEKYKGDLGMAALAATAALTKMGATDPDAKAMADGMREVLSFVGDTALAAGLAKGVDEAMKYVASRAPAGNRQHLMPGTFVQPSWLSGVTIYVLGPPHDEKKIKNLGTSGNPELYELSGSSVSAFEASSKLFTNGGQWRNYYQSLGPLDQEKLDSSMPFEGRYRIEPAAAGSGLDSYNHPQSKWRRVESDWLLSSSDLALQLDNLTNNTSLALAYEIGEDGPVILMAADAQLGNWLSWHDYTWEVPRAGGTTKKIVAKDLLARTVIYKVGHHSSHNATAVAHGLEMMTNSSLVALIPLDKKVAIQKKWPMPAEKLYERLVEKTRGNVLRSDVGWPEDSVRPVSVAASDWKKLSPNVQIDVKPKYIDVVLTA